MTKSAQMAAFPSSERFPALRRLGWRGRGRRMTPVQQLEWSDCGAASLAMVLGYHGRPVRLDEVRDVTGSGRDGTSARAILRAAEWFGLRGRGLSLSVDALVYLPPASILHWELDHFVVFERVTRQGKQRGVDIVDPAVGRRFVPMEQLRRTFSGVALVFEPTEALRSVARTPHRALAYLKQVLGHWPLLSRIVVTSLLLRLFALSLPILTGLIVDRVVPRDDTHLLAVAGAGLAMVVVFQFLSALIRSHLLLQLRTNLDTRMTLGFLDHLVNLPYAYFQRRSAGDLMMRVNSNTTIREILTTNTLSGLLDGALVVVYIALIFFFSPGMGGLVLAMGLLQILVLLAARRRYRELMARHLDTQAKAQGYLVQVMAGIESLKATGAEHRAVERWSNLFVDELNVSLARGRLSALVDGLMTALQGGAPLLILGYGALLVIGGDMSLGTMLALLALAVGFLLPLSSLVASALQLQLLGSYIERIDDVLVAEPEQQPERVRRPPRLRGRITVEDVSFRHGPHAPLVVRQVSLAIEPGSAVAIVGRSGSGKSTLANLLMGMYRPEEGRVRYDGHDLGELDLRSVRRQLGIVPQQPYIFGTSIRENILLVDPGMPAERAVEAARQACIHDDIVAMPMGYETVIADGGASLSGGQRQRLALARALATRPAILLLDEATSALDTETEQRVMRNLGRLACTRIIIAHRLSTIAGADAIVVMEDGRVIEQGVHRELLACEGAYRELVAAQADFGAGEAR